MTKITRRLRRKNKSYEKTSQTLVDLLLKKTGLTLEQAIKKGLIKEVG